MESFMIYHGSNKEIRSPRKENGRINNDYGQGFYLTKYKELASRWACRFFEDGIVNEYQIDLDELKVLNLDENYHLLNWLAILVENREFTNINARRNAKFVSEKYNVPYKRYDVIIGYRADDAYYKFIREFLMGIVGLNTMEKAMYLGEQGLQVFIQSEKAFSRLRFIRSYKVAKDDFYYVNKQHIDNANNEYEVLKEKNEMKDTFIRDIKGGDVNEKSIPRIKIK